MFFAARPRVHKGQRRLLPLRHAERGHPEAGGLHAGAPGVAGAVYDWGREGELPPLLYLL